MIPDPEDAAPIKKRKRNRVTKLQRAIVRARLKYPNKTQKEIANKLGITQPHFAGTLAKPHVRESMLDIMDRAGVTDDFIAKKVRSLQDAKTTKFFAHEGVVQDEKTVDDNGTQLAATNLAAEIRGHKQKKMDVTSNGNTIKALLLEDD